MTIFNIHFNSLLTTALCIAIFASCNEKHGGEKEPEEEKPFPVGTWRTNHHFFNLTVDEVTPTSSLQSVREMREQETSHEVTEAESYRLWFDENGTGFGSGVRPGSSGGYYSFTFSWQMSDGRLTIAGGEAGSAESGVFLRLGRNIITGLSEWKNVENVSWEIEESGTDKMVLLWSPRYEFSNTSRVIPSWIETQNYRYTFEKAEWSSQP